MTREMNKPDWCKSKTLCGWWQSSIKGICEKCPDYKPKERVLDDWIEAQMNSINERFKQCGKQ